jgi:hypothetical protein
MSKELTKYLPNDIIDHIVIPYLLPRVAEAKYYHQNAMELLRATFLYTSDTADRKSFWLPTHRRAVMKCLRHSDNRVLDWLELDQLDEYFYGDTSVTDIFLRFRRVMSQLHRYFRSPIDIIDCDW